MKLEKDSVFFALDVCDRLIFGGIMRLHFGIRGLALISLFLLLGLGIRGQTVEEYRAQVARLMGDFRWREALDLAEVGLTSHPSDTRLSLAASALYLQLGRTGRSLSTIRKTVERNPGDAAILRLFGELLMAAGQSEEASAVLVRAVRLNPDDGIAHFRLAQIAVEVGDDRKAEVLTARAVELLPDNADLRRFYSVLLDRLGKPEQAYAELRRGRSLDPDDARILIRLADKEKHSGRLTQAIEYLELASSADPENPLFYEELAALYGEKGQQAEAEKALRTAGRLREAFEVYARSFSLVTSGDIDEAVRRLEQAWNVNPEFLTGAVELAGLYRRLGRDTEAMNLYDEVLKRDPKRDSVREQVAWLKADSGDLDEAIELLYGAENLSPNAYLLRGYQLQLESDWDGALKQFELASRMYPLDPGILRQISLCLNSLGRVREALSYLEKAHAAQPTDRRVVEQARNVRFEYALGLENEGRWEEALTVLSRLILEEGKGEYLLHKGYCEQQLFRYEDAVRDFLAGLEYDPEADWARVNLTICLYALGRYDEAADQWEVLVEKSDQPEYIYQLGLSRIRQWRLTEGWGLVRKAAAAGWKPALTLLEKSGQSVPLP